MGLVTDTGIGKNVRMKRLGRGDGLFLVPIDHSVTDGPIGSVDRVRRIVETIARNGADGVVLHKGRARFVAPELLGDLSLVLHLSASTSHSRDTDEKVIVGEVEQALQMGADAVSVHVNLGADTEPAQLAALGTVAQRCMRWGMPLLAMVYPRGPRITEPRKASLVAHAATVAVDLGADLVKTVYTGSVDTMADVVRTCPIPVLLAGGAPLADTGELAALVREMMSTGAAGVAMGRNIFHAKNVAQVTREIAGIVHGSPGRRISQPALESLVRGGTR